MAFRDTQTLRGETARLWMIKKSKGKIQVSQLTPIKRQDVPGCIYPFFCVGHEKAGKPGYLDELVDTLGGQRKEGHVVCLVGIYSLSRTFPEDLVCYLHSSVASAVFSLSKPLPDRYADLMRAGMQPSLLRSVMMSSLNRKAFWDALQSEMDAVGERPMQEQSCIRRLIRGMPDILISTIQLRPESVASRLLVEHRCFNTVGPLDTRFAGMFNGSDICPYSFEIFKQGVSYPEKRFPTFSIKRVRSGKQVHFNGTEVKFTGIKSEAPTPFASFMSYGALNCPDRDKMLVIFMHVMADGGPADSSASLKCRVLFSVQFPFKDRKRKVHHHDVHPLAIFEAVSGRVLEQLMRTGMTSKGGIRPILTLEGKFHFTLIPTELGLTKSVGHPFHAAESYTERIFRGDNPYGIVLKWRGLSIQGPINLPSAKVVSFGTIIRHVVEQKATVLDRPLSELILKYIHGRRMEDYSKEPDQLPLEAVLALELIRYQFVRTLELIKKYDIEDRVEDWASGELKDFILYIKQLYEPGGMLKYNFEEFLAHSIEGCAGQCKIYFEDSYQWPLSNSNPNLIVVPGTIN